MRVNLFARLSILFSFLLLMTLVSASCAARTSSTGDTGYFKSQFTGMEAYIYNLLENKKPSSDNYEFKLKYTYNSGESKDEVEAWLIDRAPYVMEAFLYDHLDDFNWAADDFGIKNIKIYDTYATATMYYVKSSYYSSKTEKQVDKVLTSATQSLINKERETQVRALYEWICNQATYNNDAFSGKYDEETQFYAHSPLGVLLKGTGVCESYAKAFKLLCDRLDIPCTIAKNSEHMWNYVQMEDGHWYMVDTTWADSKSKINYAYLLAANSPAINASHKAINTLSFPEGWYLSYEEGKGHNYVVSNSDTASCTKQGTVKLICKECNDVKSFTTDSYLHTYRMVSKKGTSSTGYDYSYQCKTCSKKITEHYYPCSGHNWQEGDYTWNSDYSTCTLNIRCSLCNTKTSFIGYSTIKVLEANSYWKKGSAEYTAILSGHLIDTYEGNTLVYYSQFSQTTTADLPKKTLSKVTWGDTALLNTSKGIKLTWKRNSKADGYRIFRSEDGDSFKKLASLKTSALVGSNGDAASFAWTDTDASVNGKRYTYKIIAYKKVEGKKVTSKASEYKTKYHLSKPSIKSLQSKSSNTLTVTWGRNSKATGYQIRFARSSAMTNARTLTVSGNTTTTKTISKLSGGKKFYVKIRSYKTVSGSRYYSCWSDIVSATTKK